RSRRRPIVIMRRAHLFPGQASAVAAILGKHPDALIVSVREPFDVAVATGALHVLCTYGDEEPSMVGLAEVLTGRAAPAGTLPVELGAVR
ncbi:MAG: hypothetical protein M3M96_07700, partial [Candidatus Eremiobacteraeota bacterium]|nr:hypothetical protein [Candidatus Eremiobacteraeota bacterium]